MSKFLNDYFAEKVEQGEEQLAIFELSKTQVIESLQLLDAAKLFETIVHKKQYKLAAKILPILTFEQRHFSILTNILSRLVDENQANLVKNLLKLNILKNNPKLIPPSRDLLTIAVLNQSHYTALELISSGLYYNLDSEDYIPAVYFCANLQDTQMFNILLGIPNIDSHLRNSIFGYQVFFHLQQSFSGFEVTICSLLLRALNPNAFEEKFKFSFNDLKKYFEQLSSDPRLFLQTYSNLSNDDIENEVSIITSKELSLSATSSNSRTFLPLFLSDDLSDEFIDSTPLATQEQQAIEKGMKSLSISPNRSS